MELQTDRLLLRQLRDSDAAAITRNVADLDVSRWLALVPHPYTERDALDWIAATRVQAEMPSADRRDHVFGIELRRLGSIIGAMSISNVDRARGSGEIGYWFGADYHGRGYATESMARVLDYAFNQIHLLKLEAGVFKGNQASGKLLLRNGFVVESHKTRSKTSRATGIVHDEILYGLGRDAYFCMER